MTRVGVVVVKTTGLPTDRRGAPSPVPHFPVSVALAWQGREGPRVWASLVGITRAVAERKDLPEALRFGGLTLDKLRGAPAASDVAKLLRGLLAEHAITHLAAWQGEWVTHFIGGEPWGLGTQYARILDVQAQIGRAAPPGTFTTNKPSIEAASAYVAGARGAGILPPDRTAEQMAIQVAHIVAEIQRLRAFAAVASRKES